MTIYLETTVVNRYFECDREYALASRTLFDNIRLAKLRAITSTAVLEEINSAPPEKRDRMLALLSECNVEVLDVNQEIYDLANVYVEMGIIPTRFFLDAVHIACAAVYDVECIVSLNFHHINKLKTKMASDIVNRMKGYCSPFICTPAEVIDDDL